MTPTEYFWSLLPTGWTISSITLNYNTEQWQVTAWDELWTGHAVMQSADTIEEALAMATKAIQAQDYWAPNATRSRLATAASDILSLIGLKPKAQEPVKRRVIP